MSFTTVVYLLLFSSIPISIQTSFFLPFSHHFVAALLKKGLFSIVYYTFDLNFTILNPFF